MVQRPQSLYGAAQVRELDRIAIEDRGIDGYELMKRAGLAAYRVLRARWPGARTVGILCGSGNNGGDGYVIGRLAHGDGLRVLLFAVGEAKTVSARQAAADYCDCGAALTADVAAVLGEADVVVDAMLGTGLERAVGGRYLELIERTNAGSAPALAIDVPSGLDGDRGCVMGAAVKASATITFIGQKMGLYTAAGPEWAGEIHFDDLRVPDDIYTQVVPLARRIVPAADGLRLARRPRDAHKGNAGNVLVVGGEHGMLGAAMLAGRAACRSGAGLVRIATRADHAPQMSAACPELMANGVETALALKPHLDAASVVAIGPGLGQGAWGADLLTAALECHKPLVVDADALNLLGHEPERSADWVLTPHPGEAARLLNCAASEVQHDRRHAVLELQRRFGGVVVLKGAGTLVCDGQVWLCDRGNPGMGVGGMGDVLTGVIAALLAQGSTLSQAARYGVWLHAAAGDSATSDGEIGLGPRDLLPWLRRHVNALD